MQFSQTVFYAYFLLWLKRNLVLNNANSSSTLHWMFCWLVINYFHNIWTLFWHFLAEYNISLIMTAHGRTTDIIFVLTLASGCFLYFKLLIYLIPLLKLGDDRALHLKWGPLWVVLYIWSEVRCESCFTSEVKSVVSRASSRIKKSIVELEVNCQIVLWFFDNFNLGSMRRFQRGKNLVVYSFLV